MAKRATQAEIAQRTRIVYEMLLNGAPKYDIAKFAKTQWNISPRTIDHYIARATSAIKETAAEAQKDALAEHIAQRRLLLYKSAQAGDHRLALEIQRDTAKLLGLYPAAATKNLNIDLDKIDLDQLTDAQLEALARGEIPFKSIRIEPVLDWDNDDAPTP